MRLSSQRQTGLHTPHSLMMITNVLLFDPRSPDLHHFVYVDNLGVLAMDESKALAVMGDLDSLFPERGLLLHEASCGSGRRES